MAWDVKYKNQDTDEIIDTYLESRLGREVTDKNDLDILCTILNSVWADINVTPKILKERFVTDNPFLVVYANAMGKDVAYLKEKGIYVKEKELIPIGILETIAVKAEGDAKNIPKTYSDLTNNGSWTNSCKNADTLIFVDVSFLYTRSGKRTRKKEAQHFMNWVLAYTAATTDYRGYYTYTPDIPGVINWHIDKFGAIDSKERLTSGRNMYNKLHEPSPIDVAVMDYNEKIENLKKDYSIDWFQSTLKVP